MDEGAVIAYAARVLDGAVPHRDFLTFYGPGNPWLVAGAFAVVRRERRRRARRRAAVPGRSSSSRSFSLGLAPGRCRRRRAARLVIAATIMADELIWAYATYGALAFGLLGLALARVGGDARHRRDERDVATRCGGRRGGLLRCSCASTSRPRSSLGASAPRAGLAARRGSASAAASSRRVGVYVVHLAIVGPERIGRARRRPAGQWAGAVAAAADDLGATRATSARARACSTGVLLIVGALLLWRRAERPRAHAARAAVGALRRSRSCR